jgi:hypothetical protein
MHHATTTIILFVACWIAYVNSLRGDFIFDDHFAVTQNRDVLLHKVGRLEFLRNDFWGQPLTSTSSHKSYRCLYAPKLNPRIVKIMTYICAFLTISFLLCPLRFCEYNFGCVYAKQMIAKRVLSANRPLTVLLFRCLGTIGRRSLPGRSTSDVAPEKTDGSSLNSWPFHFANIMLHATATILVYW